MWGTQRRDGALMMGRSERELSAERVELVDVLGLIKVELSEEVGVVREPR